ncbi:MAG TPA: CBS domain-containing protein [Verrucomicrobiae bacterium]|nr:CBS domain-containing protein [Verrucomicrobiae bacterium]
MGNPNLKIQDIMEPSLVVVQENATIKELMALIHKHGISDFPVVDDTAVLKGMIHEKSLLQILYPDSRSRPQNLSDPEFLKEVTARYDHMRVSDIMLRDMVILNAEDTVMKAAASILLQATPKLPVFKSGHLIGVVSQVRVIAEVLEESVDQAKTAEIMAGASKGYYSVKATAKLDDNKEKRFFRRVDLEMPIAYRLPQSEGSGKLATSINISGGGLLVLTHEKLPAEARVDVAFDIYKNGEPLKIQSRVVRCVPAAEPGTFQVGLLFLDLDNDARLKLIHHLDKVCPEQLES